jgi:hypothetical protein
LGLVILDDAAHVSKVAGVEVLPHHPHDGLDDIG